MCCVIVITLGDARGVFASCDRCHRKTKDQGDGPFGPMIILALDGESRLLPFRRG